MHQEEEEGWYFLVVEARALLTPMLQELVVRLFWQRELAGFRTNLWTAKQSYAFHELFFHFILLFAHDFSFFLSGSSWCHTSTSMLSCVVLAIVPVMCFVDSYV